MTDLVERVAKSDAEFDGRAWEAMPAADRKRYLARAGKSVAICVHESAMAPLGLGQAPSDPGEYVDYDGFTWRVDSDYGRGRRDSMAAIMCLMPPEAP